MRHRVVIGVSLLGLACGQPFWKVPPPPPEPVFPTAQAAAPIDSIRFQHTGCLGWCPVYTYMLRLSGSATYEGVDFAPVLGRYRAELDAAAFERLVRTLREKHFLAMRRDYSSPLTDLSSVVTTVFLGDTLKRVWHYGAGEHTPPELREIELAIEAVGASLHWQYEGPASRR